MPWRFDDSGVIRRAVTMPETSRLRGVLSPQTGDDTLSLVTGQPTTEQLRQMPSQATSAFESLRALSQHLSKTFNARLVFVSCRDTSNTRPPEMLFDTSRSGFAAERARLYGQDLPLDVAVGMNGSPLLWCPHSEPITIAEDTSDGGQDSNSPDARPLIAVPYQAGPLLALCVVQPTRIQASEDSEFNPIAWHCVQYLAEHFQRHPLHRNTSSNLLSPQEERIILKCGAGLTDKEIGREMDISPHTVRTHVNSAKAKLGAKNKTHAVMLFNGYSARL